MTSPSRPAPTPQRTPRCWTLCSPDGAVDVEVVAHDEEPLGGVLAVLERALDVPVAGLWAGSSRLPDDLPLSAPELAHAAVLGLGRPGPRGPERFSALELHVVGGPVAGQTLPLGQGRHVLGRGAEATVRLDDPDVSRRHAEISVGAGQITVADLGSTNGSRLDDVPLTAGPRVWPSGGVLRAGASTLTIRGPEGSPAAVAPAPGGRVAVHPPHRMPGVRADVEVEFPRPPGPPPRRRLAWVAMALPALAGVTMAVLLQTPQFLFFGLLGPAVALGTWVSERWTGRRDGRREAAVHAVAVLDAESRLATALRADRRTAQVLWPDLATLASAARRRSSRLWERRRTDADALQIRVGSARGASGVTRVTGDGTRVRELADDLPVVVDLRTAGGLAVIGPRGRSIGVLTAAVAQLAALHGADDVQLALVTDGERLAEWDWVRWLPHLRRAEVPIGPEGDSAAADEHLLRWAGAEISARRASADEPATGPGALPWLVVVVDRRLDPRVTWALRAGRGVGVVVLTTAEAAGGLPVVADAVLELAGETGDVGVLRRAGLPDVPAVAVDRLPRSAATTLARNLATLTPAGAAARLPRELRLLDLPGTALTVGDDDRVDGAWPRSRASLVATLGRTADGPARIDLCAQGPHALVAGTTGSGKSELLQSLIAGLALNHPPDRCSFLLVDYKGGAAFAEAVTLPHTVGLVTDLDAQSTDRALRSLGAELTRRESLLAEHRVADLMALPPSVEMARLVIVVDEFATLAEEHPSFIPGLVGIAQRGRSLGVHLVLATQRPGGVVSPEIRANCSLRICLRTTDEADSRDVVGTSQAAFLPIELPGRAYVRTGTTTPVEIQVARVAVTASGTDPAPVAQRWAWPHPVPVPAAETAAGDRDLARVAAALRRHAADSGAGLPHRPWRPPLPARVRAEDLDPRPAAGSRLTVGLVDRPEAQAQEPLEIDLADAGGWLAVGGARSGRTTLLRTVLAEAVTRLGPDDLHVHVLDHGGGRLAAEAARLSHTGTTVAGDDPLRTLRLVDRLAEEIAARRATQGPVRRPSLLLLVDGVESVSTQLDEFDPGRGSGTLLRLVRDGGAAGLTCVLTADRAVPGGRLAAAADRRLVLPLADRADYAVAGVPARAVPDVRPPGRALFGEAAAACQLALPRPIQDPAGAASATRPLRIPELAADPRLPLPQEPLPERDGRPCMPPLVVGPGGDEGGILSVDLQRTGGLLVAGPPGSGRTSALEAFATRLAHSEFPVLFVGAPPGATSDPAPGIDRLSDLEPAHAAAALTQWLADHGDRPRVVVVDDLGALADTPLVAALPTAGGSFPVVLLAGGQAADLARIFQGPVAALRRGRSGLLLSPGAGDADLLGVRLPRAPVPVRPGSGWLVTDGVTRRVQVARQPEPA